MCRETRRDLIIAIDSLEFDQRRPRQEFYRHGYREFFGSVSHDQETDKELLIEFIRFFCFDSEDTTFNGFQEPWIVIMTLCAQRRSRVTIASADGFRDQLRGLLLESAAWDLFNVFLERELLERS